MRTLSIFLLILVAGCPQCCVAQEDLYSQLPPNRPGYVWVYSQSQIVNVQNAYSTSTTTHSTQSTTQSYAQSEANRLAAGGRSYYRAHGGHPGGNMPGARFTGTGYSYSPSNIPTCEPRTPMTLIADAVQRGVDGLYYRVRAWR